MVGRLTFFRMAIPDFGIGRVATPAIFALRLARYARVFWPSLHGRRFAAYDRQKDEESNDANRNKEKPEVFSIHKN